MKQGTCYMFFEYACALTILCAAHLLKTKLMF